MGNKVAIFMLFGQSNAVGHAMPMKDEDIIREPLKNVWGLNREPNQSFDTERLKFSHYTSFGMNLAETQDNTYSVANQLAKRWQAEIDNGNPSNLPDLYVIQIAIGSQGLFGMWKMGRKKKLIPGKLGDVDISLYPYTCHILKLLRKHLKECNLEAEFVGLHWRGGEQETRFEPVSLRAELKPEYKRFFAGLRRAIGSEHKVPIVLHRLPFKDVMLKEDPSGTHLQSMEYINQVFDELAKEQALTSTFEPKDCPFYDEYAWDKNIFRWDLIHYTGEMNDWVASKILDDFIKTRKNT